MHGGATGTINQGQSGHGQQIGGHLDRGFGLNEHQGGGHDHSEGPVARAIKQRTAQLPSDWFLWAAGASILGSISLMATGNRHGSLFVGQWAPTFLLLGLYNKIVKVAGSDSREAAHRMHPMG
jgi:hypothetical protein